jgi:hypothetical protein
VKVGVWYDVSARRIVVPVFLPKQLIAKKYLCVACQHFQHFIWSVNCNYFIPNVIGRQACWFIGKIRVRLAAGGAPVVVKRRSVESINKVKNPPCIPYAMSQHIFNRFVVRDGKLPAYRNIWTRLCYHVK